MVWLFAICGIIFLSLLLQPAHRSMDRKQDKQFQDNCRKILYSIKACKDISYLESIIYPSIISVRNKYRGRVSNRVFAYILGNVIASYLNKKNDLTWNFQKKK
jgi:hypothetical protein